MVRIYFLLSKLYASYFTFQVAFNFEDNLAIVGSAFYVDRISQCSWTRVLYPYFSLDNTLKWSFINYRYTRICKFVQCMNLEMEQLSTRVISTFNNT